MNMNKFRSFIIKVLLVCAAVLVCPPSWAVFNEKDLSRTLQVLRYELCKSYSEISSKESVFKSRDEVQHRQLIRLTQRCNELSLMLYSQKQDFTFDLTYALRQVTDMYHNFTQSRMPYDNIISYLDVEIERYERLIGALKMLPPELVEVPDSLGPNLIDSLALVLKTHSRPHHHDNDIEPEPDIIPDLLPASADTLVTDPLIEEEDHLHHEHFVLDSLSQVARDSCLFYSENILDMYTDLKEHLVEDNDHYETANKRLKEAYDYAQERYKLVQKKIFIDGQTNYWKVLTSFRSTLKTVSSDFNDKYGRSFLGGVRSEWRGPKVLVFSLTMMVFLALAVLLSYIVIAILKRWFSALNSSSFKKREFAILLLLSVILFVITILVLKQIFSSHFFDVAAGLLLEYSMLLITTLASIIIRNSSNQVDNSLRIYIPVMLMGLMVISFRIIFIPNSLINLIYPPVLLLFGIWQVGSIRSNKAQVSRADKVMAYASLVITAVTLGMSLCGYCLLALQVYIWWIFQLTFLQIFIAMRFLLHLYRNKRVDKLIVQYKRKHPSYNGNAKGGYITVTWLYDAIEMTIIPLLVVLSFPFCFFMASKVFDLTEICKNIFNHPFFNYEYFHISLTKIVVASALFFIFKYICYALKSFYRLYKMQHAIGSSGTGYVLQNQVNLTLGNNAIGIVVWGFYALAVVFLLNIPIQKLSIITAGLAAGLGFAMKDILNNFFYGIQLMSGRLRVGDTIECDGIRGTVDNISYQTTQIIGLDGSLIAFPNSTLFSKSFKNLTRSDSYECIVIPVGVAYGTDVDKARSVIVNALDALRVNDKFGRPMIKQSYGIQVFLTNFGDSSVDLSVKQYVLVEQRNIYIAEANELIYNALNEAGIEIPFPQVDLNFKNSIPSDNNNN